MMVFHVHSNVSISRLPFRLEFWRVSLSPARWTVQHPFPAVDMHLHLSIFRIETATLSDSSFSTSCCGCVSLRSARSQIFSEFACFFCFVFSTLEMWKWFCGVAHSSSVPRATDECVGKCQSLVRFVRNWRQGHT